MQRLDKILSDAGVASRKELRGLIRTGRVQVNGVPALRPEEKFDEKTRFRRFGVMPVGRLDKATEGLLLFTNDGVLAHRLISPRSGVWKRYYAEHTGEAGEEDVRAFAEGMTLGDGTQCLPARLTPLGPGRSQVEIQEGKYHQVRRMLAARGMPVSYLRREAEGTLLLDGLRPGEVRELPLSALDGVF